MLPMESKQVRTEGGGSPLCALPMCEVMPCKHDLAYVDMPLPSLLQP